MSGYAAGHLMSGYAAGNFMSGYAAGHFMSGHAAGHFMSGYAAGHFMSGYAVGHFMPLSLFSLHPYHPPLPFHSVSAGIRLSSLIRIYTRHLQFVG